MFRRSFLFGVDTNTVNVIGVHSKTLYSPEKGYGFVIEQNRREQELLRLSELNSAFDTAFRYQGEDLTLIEEDSDGCFVDSNAIVAALEENGEQFSGEHRRIPLSFKADVPRQGNYRVVLTIQAQEPLKEVLVFTGRRRLSFRGDIPAGKFVHTMIINVCDIVPKGQTRIFTDKTLDITVVADKPRISKLSITEVACPTIYIAGDSVASDQSADYPYAPGTGYSGWGQMLSAYMKNKIAVSNHARSDANMDSFRKEGHFSVINQYSKPGDFFFFQFGHDDRKSAISAGYPATLVRYINECKDRGVYPVLVTPIVRSIRDENDSIYNDLLKEYAEACQEVGRVAEAPVLDLYKQSMSAHSNDYGAYKMAGFVAGEIKRICGKHSDSRYRFLARCVTEGFGEWGNLDE